MLVGTGKFLIAERIVVDGVIPSGVRVNPAKSTVVSQNLNLSECMTMPFCAQRER